MTNERYRQLIKDPNLNISKEEFEEGWHFCYEWDGLLIGPGMKEMECCLCYNTKIKGEDE